MNLTVCIHVTEAMKEDLYRLYCRRSPVGQAIMVLVGLAFWPIVIPPPVNPNFTLEYRIYVGIISVLLIISAFTLKQIWWRWFYWPRVQRDYSPAMAPYVRLSATGIQRDADTPEFPYGGYCGVAQDERVVLLYLTKSYAVPFHRSLFATEADWQLFRNAVTEAFKHRTLFQRLSTPL